jgi:hypothetical protein
MSADETPPDESAWLSFSETEYYNRVFAIIQKGCTEAEADMILANVFSAGFSHGKSTKNNQ